MSNDLKTCPYCGYVATEGEFHKNEGCPCKDCVGYRNMKNYKNDDNEMALATKQNPLNRATR